MVLDEAGALLDSRTVPLPISRPDPVRVEQDPHALLDAVAQAAGPLLERHAVAAAGLDNQGESFLLWDADTGEPVTPSIVWQDQRGAGVCARLQGQVDAAWLAARTGLTLDSYFCAPKLAQVLESQPELRARARQGRLRFGTTDTWVLWNLSGGALHLTDVSTASRTLLFNLTSLAWDEELLSLFDIPRALLPEVRPSAGDLGTLRVPGCSRPLPLWALLTDQQAALFGQACFQPGDAKCTLGTGAFLLMNTGATPRPSRHGLLTTVAWQVGNQVAYAADGGIFCAGAAVQWLAEGLKVIDSVAASDAAARRARDDGVVVVPALQGLSAPRWWTEARGAVLGVSARTTGEDLARATLDGLAQQVADVVEAMEQDAGQPLSVLRVDGGPTRNAYLVQALADALDREVQVAQAQEATATGVAHLAQHARTGIPTAEFARRWRCREAYHPVRPAGERTVQRERWHRAVRALGLFHGRPV